ncbi:MAG: FG-GAP repeat protein, partial [Anaerolineae bacterium]|nr:FG-GAP repeat protein [Anaerolineae bacterium]
TDTDGDGISDRDENCLGTDPYRSDTDYDRIPDKVELDGIEWPAGSGHMWYGDPISPDTNNDGLNDLYEWPKPYGTAPEWDVDNDGIPNPWDDDNDGDGVPDKIDLSPYAYTDYISSFTLSTRGSGFNGFEYIEVQVRPQNTNHLRYTIPALDWPRDTQGQIREYDDNANDIRLVPMLRIKANVAPPTSLAERYRISSRQYKEEGNTYYELHVPLTPIVHHGTNVAFSARVPYAPDQIDDIRWLKTEMVWLVTVDNYTGERQHQWTALATYTDTYTLTGLSISTQTSYKFAIFGTPLYENDDRHLFNVALGAGATFMRYRDRTLEDLASRFTCTDNCADEATWGADPRAVDVSGPATYQDRDEALVALARRESDFLTHHRYSHNSHPSLLVAIEDTSGTWNLDDWGHGKLSQPSFGVSLGGIPSITARYLRLGTYAYRDNEWQSLDSVELIRVMLDRYSEDSLRPVVQALHDKYPEITTRDLRGIITLFYTSWNLGEYRVVRAGGQDQMKDAPAGLDQDLYDRMYKPDPPYDNLAAYLLEVADLAKPGGGMRVGATFSQEYEYRRAHSDLVDAFHIPPSHITFITGFAVPSPNAPVPNIGVLLARDFLATTFALYSIPEVYKALGGWMKWDRLLSHKLGIATTAVSMVFTWVMFGVTTDFSNPIAIKYALTWAIANTIIGILFLIASLNPVSAIIAAVIYLLDLIILVITSIIVGEGFSIIAFAALILARMFYSAHGETYVEDPYLYGQKISFADEERGAIEDNAFLFEQDFKGSIAYTDESEEDDREASKFEGYLWASNTKGWASTGTSGYYKNDDKQGTLSVGNHMWAKYAFSAPGRNIKLQIKPKFDATVAYDECGLWGAICKGHYTSFTLPDALDESDRWEAQSFYIDVLPKSLDSLWTWDQISNHDVDGDGLSDEQEAVLGTDPNNWDTDGDGLSDRFEVDHREDMGTDPLNRDTDGDGLIDSLEVDWGTLANDPDTDRDGLPDGVEVFHQDVTDMDHDGDTSEWVGGMQTVSGLPESTQSYRMYTIPVLADADGDRLNDHSERDYETSPFAYNAFPQLTLDVSPLRQGPDGARSAYLKPGDPITLTITLENNGPKAITTTLRLCLPDFITSLQGGDMQGDRQPPRQAASGCHGFQWNFGGGDTLNVYESVHTTVRGTAANVASARGDVIVSFPYLEGKIIRQNAVAVLDSDVPSVNFLAPLDGAVIGGGISDYVIGGTSHDDTTWVTRVHLTLPGGTADITDTVNPWAYTWHLPADGVYTLHATATDFVGNASAPAEVQVTVDNTAPQVSTSFPDDTYFRGETGSVITVTLQGSASDNLSGLVAVQASLDGKPWHEVWTSKRHPLQASWTAQWTLPDAKSASGRHVARVRALDRAGNEAILTRSFIVDVLPPTTELSNRIYVTNPPHVLAGHPHTLYGVSNDAGHAPKPPHPKELVGKLHSLNDATIWLGLPTVWDNDEGVTLAWLGDFNNDRLADAVLGLPAAEGGKGRVVVVYGRAGNWPAPVDMENLYNSRTVLIGANNAHLGQVLAPLGDVNGDGYDDLIIGDPNHKRAFLVMGFPTSQGHYITLDGPNPPHWYELQRYDGGDMGAAVAPAGDVNMDGIADMLVASGSTVYLLLGQADIRSSTFYVDRQAAAAIDVGSANARFTGVGDVDDDGYDDFVIAVGTTI